MRLTKIVCTLGPASHSPDMIRSLIDAGMDIARINFSHVTQESHRKTIHAVKDARSQSGKSVALMLDTKGAEIRTGDVEKPIEIAEGQEAIFSYDDVPGATLPVIRVSYPDFAKDVQKAECIIIDNGTTIFDLVRIDGNNVIAKARDSGSITSRRHINLPGADISLPSMTPQDWSDLENVGIPEEMDLIALSFIRTAEEVQEVRKFINKHKSNMRIMTKIETRQSVANIDAIIDASDSIMIARGDLGAEMPFEKIPAIQDMIVAKCRAKNKPVLVATQMLESMITNPTPTRAEVTDIAHAATTRADATMLSGETAAGEFPLLAIDAMSRTLSATEALLPPDTLHRDPCNDIRKALADSGVSMAKALSIPLIIVITASGETARAVSMLRPTVPILACTENPAVERSLHLHYGVIPCPIVEDADPEVTVLNALDIAKERGLAKTGEDVVVIADARASGEPIRAAQLRKAH